MHTYVVSISIAILLHVSDVLYAWESPEYKVVEDSESVAVRLCQVSDSGTLTFPVEVDVVSTPISATGNVTMNVSK